ncbi:DinB family protein [Streptomyces sp. Edi2]|uniref:DinB family protein n=1 Tax=Streptomyces sp. Edi2 TaxID=3162528 RepID=UPI003305B119
METGIPMGTEEPGRETGGARTDRLGLLLDQFDQAREMAQVRLTGLGDEEYLWEPVAGCWSIRRRGEAATPRAYGPGEWVLDKGAPDIPASEYAEVARQAAGGMSVAKIADDWSVSVERVEQVLAHTGTPEPDETPVATIAWRLAHLHSGFAGRWEWAFGARRQEPKLLVDFTPSAALALERFWTLIDRWRDSVATVTDEQLDTVGFSQYPYGSDPDDPFIAVLAGANLEFIHHMAEIALLRDLWRARFTTGG